MSSCGTIGKSKELLAQMIIPDALTNTNTIGLKLAAKLVEDVGFLT